MSPRVLHVLESMAPGGMETTFLNILRTFRSIENGARPTLAHDVLALGAGPLESEFRRAAENIFISPDLRELDKILSRHYHVVHLLFERCAHRLAPWLLSRGDSAVVYSKGYDISSVYRMEGGFHWRAEDSLLAACDAVTFTTPDLASHYSVPPERATVLGKAVDFETFARVPPVNERTPERILCVANLHPCKRLADLAPALQILRKRIPKAEIRIVGRGNPTEVDRLKERAVAAGVVEAFTLAGASNNIPEELEACRVVVLPSGREGAPTCLLEAMAAGRPVVATRVGHVESIVTDGKEGFLVTAGDVEALADRLFTLLQNPILSAQLGRAGRLRAARHDVRGIAAKLLDLLRTAADE